jgi:hypothetical protein
MQTTLFPALQVHCNDHLISVALRKRASLTPYPGSRGIILEYLQRQFLLCGGHVTAVKLLSILAVAVPMNMGFKVWLWSVFSMKTGVDMGIANAGMPSWSRTCC